MNTSSNIIWNPSEMWIRPQSLVMFCGIANSGKSTLAKKLFHGKEIINTDEILEQTINQLFDITKRDLGITPESKIWGDISEHMGRIAFLKAQELVNQTVISKSKEQDIVVFDSAPYIFEHRLRTIANFEPYFKNIYLIVVFPDSSEILKHKVKSISENQKALGFYYPDHKSVFKDQFTLRTQITAKNIAFHVTETFIITELNNEIKVLQGIFMVNL